VGPPRARKWAVEQLERTGMKDATAPADEERGENATDRHAAVE